jgi:hypothetical protein
MKKMRKIGIGLLLALWAVLALSLWFGPKADYTYAERRQLAQMPELSVRSVLWGERGRQFAILVTNSSLQSIELNLPNKIETDFQHVWSCLGSVYALVCDACIM